MSTTWETFLHSAAFSWIIVTVICVIVESISWSLTSIWFAVGALVVAIMEVFMPSSSAIQICTFLGVSALLLFTTKPLVKNYVMSKIEKTNIDAIIGQSAYVINEITDKCSGRVKFSGKTWKAESDEYIAKDEKVTIIAVTGVTLKVAKIKDNEVLKN